MRSTSQPGAAVPDGQLTEVRGATQFGLYNLPSESWHWSMDGVVT